MSSALDGWRDRLGLAGLLMAAALSWLGPAGFYAGLLLMLVAFMADWRAWRPALRDPLVLAVLVCLGWFVLRWLMARLEGVIPVAEQIEGLRDWAMLLLFPVFAWWLRGDVARLQLTWSIVLLGMLIGLLGSLDVQTLEAIAHGQRYGFHLKKPIALALYVATLGLGLLLLAPRCWGARAGWMRRLRIASWVAVLALLALTFIAAQARGALLALVLVWPGVLLLRYRRSLHSPRAWITAMLLVGALLGLGANYAERFLSRFHDEPEAVSALVSGDFREAPASSLGWRLRLWAYGFDKWRERPLIGWGPGASITLLAASGDPRLNHPDGKPFDHLHNTYLELLVAFGLVGGVLATIIVVLLVQAIRRAWRSGFLAEDHALWLLGTLAFTALWALTDYRSQHHDWQFFWLMLAGSAYALSMQRAAAARP